MKKKITKAVRDGEQIILNNDYFQFLHSNQDEKKPQNHNFYCET